MEAGLQSHAVSQAVRDREASAALQLGQHDDHLSGVKVMRLVFILCFYYFTCAEAGHCPQS